MNVLRGFAIAGTLAMLLVLGNGFLNGNFFEDGGELLRNPWGVVSVVDLYVGFALFSLWIVYREKWQVSVPWVILMMVFGFLTASVYLLWLSLKHDNVKSVLLGRWVERV